MPRARPQRDCARQAAKVWQSLTRPPQNAKPSSSDSSASPADSPVKPAQTRPLTRNRPSRSQDVVPLSPAQKGQTRPQRRVGVQTPPKVVKKTRRAPAGLKESLAKSPTKSKKAQKKAVKAVSKNELSLNEAGDTAKLDGASARPIIPPKDASPAQIQAFLANRPKLPVYRKANLLSDSKLSHGLEENDIYDVQTYGTEEFGPEPELKKRKTRKRVKKQPGDIILTFGQRARENVAPILKEIKNLKTPQAVGKKNLVRKPLNPVNLQTHVAHASQSPIFKSSANGSLAQPSINVKPPEPLNTSIDRSSFGYTRDCDDFMPSCHDNSQPAETTAPSPLANVNLTVPEIQTTCSPVRNSTINVPEQTLAKSYKTPIVPRYVRKPEGKVSTPRPDEKHVKGVIVDNLSTQELVKVAFGFDESSEDEELDHTENESLFGISPVRGQGMNNILSPSASMIHPPKPKLFSVAKTKKPTGEPYRFIIPTKTNSNRNHSSCHMSSRFPSNISKSKAESCSTLSQMKRIDGVKSHPTASSLETSSSHTLNTESIRQIPKPEVKVICPPADNMSASTQSDPSLYGDIEEEISKIPALDDSAVVVDQTSASANPLGVEQKAIEVDQNNDHDEEELDEGATDAFTVLKNESLNQSLGKKACLRKRPKKTASVKKQTQVGKATKQTLIYDMIPNDTFGEKKQMKTNKRKISESGNIEKPVDSESQEKLEPSEKKHKTGKTYCKRTLNTSVTTSPVKKPLRKDKKFEAWASLQTSHFGEVEGFDLSFG